MHTKRKPAAGKKSAAGRGGCLPMILLVILLPFVVILYLLGVFSGGILTAAFRPPRSGD